MMKGAAAKKEGNDVRYARKKKSEITHDLFPRIALYTTIGYFLRLWFPFYFKNLKKFSFYSNGGIGILNFNII